jgi:hypothetical protein
VIAVEGADDRVCVCSDYRPTANQANLRRMFLAAGGVNVRAAELLDAIANTLTTIIRDICETRGVPLRNVRGYPRGFIGPLQHGAIRCERTQRPQFWALWLTEHVLAVAAGEDASQTYNEIHRLIGDEQRDGDIGRLINRPIPQKFLGKCPTWREAERKICGMELQARADDIEVSCPRCRQTHNCNRLQLLMMNDLEREKMTVERILELNRLLPEEYRISERTLRRWRQHGKLKPRGWQRPDGSHEISRHSDDDEPLYLWPDVRKLRAE